MLALTIRAGRSVKRGPVFVAKVRDDTVLPVCICAPA